jgi:hypothetical protein
MDFDLVLKFVGELQPIVIVGIFGVSIHHCFAISNYIHNRRKKTISKTMLFVESILNDINYQSLKNVEALNLPLDEKASYSTALQLALFVGLRHNCKSFLEENGYYRLYKDKGANRDKIEKLLIMRGTQLRNCAIPYIEAVLKPDSIIRGKHEERFSTEQAIELFRTIVSRHVSEIDHEEEEINSFISSLIPLKVYKILPKYRHDSITHI